MLVAYYGTCRSNGYGFTEISGEKEFMGGRGVPSAIWNCVSGDALF